MGMFEIDLWYDGNIDYHVYFNGVMMEYPMEIDHVMYLNWPGELQEI